MMRVVLLSASVVLILTGVASHPAPAAESVQASPELRLSLHDAIQAAIDNIGDLLFTFRMWRFRKQFE